MMSKTNLKRKVRLQAKLNCTSQALSVLSEEQLDYIFTSPFSSVFLEACPGSGKTEVIGLKAAFEFSKWTRHHAGIAITTFTKSAANELFDRIIKYGGENCLAFPHFVGTFDSWMHSYILQPYAADLVGYLGKNGDKSFAIIDQDSNAGFLFTYQTIVTYKKKMQPVSVVDFYYDKDGSIVGKDSITEGILRQLSVADLKQLKASKLKFFRAGFCTYADAEMLSSLVLKNRPKILVILAKRFPSIIIDECQDLSLNQIHILEMLRSSGSSLHLVGDLNQAIYEFRKVDPSNTAAYINQIGCKRYRLSHNFRSCQPIVNATQAVLGINNKIIGKQHQRFEYPCILVPYNDSNFEQLPLLYEKIIQRHQLSPNRCAIVARGKSTLKSLQSARELYSIKAVELIANALHFWNSINRTSAEINNALLFLGKAFSLLAYEGKGNRTKYYCPEKIDPILWRICLSGFFDELAMLYPFVDGNKALSWTSWIGKLKKRLEECWHKFPSGCSEWDSIKNKLRSPAGKKDELVESELAQNKKKNVIRTTTIHSVKGETLDAILLVSHMDKSSQGGHYTHWMRGSDNNQEHLRFAYVAFSRPKHLLVLALNPDKETDIKHFTELGFALYQ